MLMIRLSNWRAAKRQQQQHFHLNFKFDLFSDFQLTYFYFYFYFYRCCYFCALSSFLTVKFLCLIEVSFLRVSFAKWEEKRDEHSLEKQPKSVQSVLGKMVEKLLLNFFLVKNALFKAINDGRVLVL